jgi:hypothetical protein
LPDRMWAPTSEPFSMTHTDRATSFSLDSCGGQARPGRRQAGRAGSSYGRSSWELLAAMRSRGAGALSVSARQSLRGSVLELCYAGMLPAGAAGDWHAVPQSTRASASLLLLHHIELLPRRSPASA